MSRHKKLFVTSALMICFGYGVAVGQYHIPPFTLLQSVKKSISVSKKSPEFDFYKTAFSLNVASNVPLLYPPIEHNYQGISQAIQNDMAPMPTSEYFNCFEDLELSTPSINNNIISIPFHIGDHLRGTAHAYYLKANQSSATGTLIIPGSGSNQSSEIIQNRGYHSNICTVANEFGDVYVLIKPNEDSRALHDGTGRLSTDFYYISLLRNGSCYSAIYLVEALALTKYIKSKYAVSGILGLSQGGEATLLTSLQAEPTFAVIASGFSCYSWSLCHANPDQIHLPGMNTVWPIDAIKEQLTKQTTHYFFSHGKSEEGIYGIDARSGLTKNYLLSGSPTNISYNAHADGHGFDLEEVRQAFEANCLLK